MRTMSGIENSLKDKIMGTTKCHKCGKEIQTVDSGAPKGRVLCDDCMQAEKKRRKKVAGIVGGVCAVVLIISVLFYVPRKGFSGVEQIEDSVALNISDKVCDISKMTPLAPPISNPAIDDIESFRSCFLKNLEEAQSSSRNFVEIPEIFVLFPFNGYEMDEKCTELVNEFCRYFKATNADSGILICGYTCDIGTAAANLSVSNKRALSVRQLMIDNGIDESKIQLEWFGKSKFSEFNYPSKALYRRATIGIKR